MLKITPLPILQDNYVWLIQDPKSNQVAAVDPGDGPAVIHYLEENNLTLNAILITHNHPDHVEGVPELIANYQPKVFGPKISYVKYITNPVREGDEVNIFGYKFKILDAPGHTLDHILYFVDGILPFLFCGDTLFSAGCGKLFEGSPKQMFNTLQKIKSLPKSTLIYPAHEYSIMNLDFAKEVEPRNSDIFRIYKKYSLKLNSGQSTLPSSIETELLINPFLRTDKPEVIVAAEKRLNRNIEMEETTFSTLRMWKDSY
ncbi:MAG: hydroxyacylglutathione hydrolase [Pseudomonadales bacterium]